MEYSTCQLHSDSWDISWYITWRRYITKIYYAEVIFYRLVIPLKALVPISNGWNLTTPSKKQRQCKCSNYKKLNKSLLLNFTVKNLQGPNLSFGINKNSFFFLFSNKPLMMVLHKSWCQISQGEFFTSTTAIKNRNILLHCDDRKLKV